jgi:signal transduction histidine kinase
MGEKFGFVTDSFTVSAVPIDGVVRFGGIGEDLLRAVALSEDGAGSPFRQWLRDSVLVGGGIARRLTFFIVVFSTLTAFLTTATQLYIEYKLDLQGISDRFTEFESAQLPILTNSVWIFDDALIRIQLDGLARLPDIETVAVLVDGKVKWSAGNQASHHVITRRFPLVQHDFGKTVDIGVFEATASLDAVYDRLIDKVMIALVANAVKSLLVAAFALMLFQMTVTRHLYRLADYAKRIDLENSDAPALILDRQPRERPDVLDQLVDSINTMRANLTGAYVASRRDEERMRRENRHLSALLHSDALRGGATAEHFAAVTETITAALGVARAGIWRLDPSRGVYRCLDLYDARPQAHLPAPELPLDSIGHFIASLERDKVMASDDIRQDERYGEVVALLGNVAHSHSSLDAGVPIDGRLGAVISAKPADAARRWTADEINFMSAIAALVAAAIEADDRQKAQQELSLYKDQLEEIVARRTAELTAANMEINHTLNALRNTQEDLIEREKLASLGSVVAGVAHEVNTPIGVGVTAASSLRHATQGIVEKLENNSLKKSDLTNYFELALRSSDILERNLGRAAELIRSFKQVAVDQSSEAVRRVELRSYVGDVLNSLQPALRKGGHRVELATGAPIELETTPSALWQIVSNLIMNSMLHAFEPAQQGQLAIEIGRIGGAVVLTYRDNGKGMPPEVRRRIFEPFFTTRRGQGGSGLGLSIVYNLVTKTLGGTIACNSTPGAGTEFIITIPDEEYARGAA